MPMTYRPEEWNELARRSWQSFYPIVHERAKDHLLNVPADEPLSLVELIERMYPEAQARGEGIDARQRMFNAMKAAITADLKDLQGWHHPGPARRWKGKNIQPHVWHRYDGAYVPEPANQELIECPCCGTKFAPEH